MTHVLVTGASGFVGQQVVRALIDRGHTVVALTHHAELPKSMRGQVGVTGVQGDVGKPETLRAAMSGIDTVIHLVGIIREFPGQGITFQKLHHEATVNVVDAAKAAGLRRYIHMSALGTRADAKSGYHQTKWTAEEYVRASGLDFTIFRPSLIYGIGDGFTSTMVPLAKAPFFPVIAGGQTKAQPIAIADVAAGFAKAIDMPQTIGQTYDVTGPETFTYKEIYRHIAEALGRPFRPLNIPVWAVTPQAMLLQYQPWFPLTMNQLTMLAENNTGDQETYAQVFGIDRTRFVEGLAFLHPKK